METTYSMFYFMPQNSKEPSLVGTTPRNLLGRYAQ